MLSLTNPLRELLRPKLVDSTNAVWRLHSRVTVFMLAFFTILLSARAYFGEPIECMSTAAPSVKAIMNSFCWILGTYISADPTFVDASWDFIEIGERMGNIPKEERVYQKYYQWVPFILAIQAFLFSFPKHLWRFCEGGQMETLCEDLVTVLPPEAWNPLRKHQTLLYLTRESRRKQTRYVAIFVGCEILNFVVVVLNMFLVNFIFADFWSSYQPAVRALFSLDMNSWASSNSIVFPKLAKCDFTYVGPSGSKQTHDALCLLPQNIVNEKIFAFLWLWFIALAVITAVQLCYRMIQLCCQSVRIQMMYSLLEPVNYHRVKRVVRDASISHWFILYQVARNINKTAMREIINDLARASQERSLSKINLEEHHMEENEHEVLEDDEVTV